MNKRNTEGYVLAYLLIVIAVMGVIAATLMTSTVQVMASQQNSIRYMQNKYEAMGEVEKLVAELEKTLQDATNDLGTVLFTSSVKETLVDAKGDATSQFELLTNGATNVNFSLPDDADSPQEGECTFTYKISPVSSWVTVTAYFSMQYTVIFDSHLEYDTETDPDNPIYIDTDYSSTIIIKSLKLESYELTTADPTSSEEGGAPA